MDPLLQRNELWSLVTFGGDIALTPEIGSPTQMTRGRTASQVIGDIATLPDAYLYYLTTTAIPVLLDCDHSFGSRSPNSGARSLSVLTMASKTLAQGRPACT